MTVKKLMLYRDVLRKTYTNHYNPKTRHHEYNGKLHGLRVDLYADGSPFQVIHYIHGVSVGYALLSYTQRVFKDGTAFGERVVFTDMHIKYPN